MKQGRIHLVWLALGLWLFAACKPSVPEDVIQPDDMEDILYDYHVSQGIASREGESTDYTRNYFFEALLKKHNVTRAEFDSSLVYYYTRADRFIEIYKNVQERLGEEALVRGASAGEVERYSMLSLSGDTADVWEGPRRLILMPQRPYHLMQFYQKCDTSYHAGDHFLMTFNNELLTQAGYSQALAYLAMTYENDSTVSQNTIVSGKGSTSLRIAMCRERVKEIKGYIMMGQRMEEKPSNDMCLMFIDGIRLIRFHNKLPEETEASKTDTVKAEKADSLKPHVRRLGERPVLRTVEKERN